ncbi:hypothetical protein ACFQ1S_42280, partial [Kibdelosporangium lantanae]
GTSVRDNGNRCPLLAVTARLQNEVVGDLAVDERVIRNPDGRITADKQLLCGQCGRGRVADRAEPVVAARPPLDTNTNTNTNTDPTNGAPPSAD